MSIGEVLERLRPEFPEVSISKIRFLEDQGLVEPERAPSGYRRFSPADLERLRYVLSVQRDHYLPLRVIREHLEAMDHGRGPNSMPGVADSIGRSVGAPVGVPVAGRPRLVEPATETLTRADLVAAAEGDERLVADLESFALIEPAPGSSGRVAGTFDAEALAVVTAAAELAGFGIEPRHLRTFRTAAERQADLVEQVVAPLRQHRGPGPAGRADEASREIASVALRLHAALLKGAIRRNGA
jgi:DNA-binding transcriptional MerR regulator